jgi:ketosteroid isomerase-like protein
MTSANVELVRSIYASWERGDFGSIEWADPEIEYVIADGPSPGRWKGLTGLREGASSWIGAWQDFRIEVDELRELDAERVLAFTYGRGRGKTSGLEVGQVASKAVDVWHIQNGKVVRFVVYFDVQHAVVDLGLPPEPDSTS